MRTLYQSFFLFAVLGLLPAAGYSQDAKAAAGSNSFNPALIGLLSLAVILIFAVALLGNVVRQLTYAYRSKMRKDRSSNTIIKTVAAIALLSLASIQAMAQEATTIAAPPQSIIGLQPTEFYFLTGFIILELLIIFALMVLISVLTRLLTTSGEAEVAAKAVKKIPFWDRFNKAVDIEKEGDIQLDHDYDGIHELDNDLPPWWKYGFIVTIFMAVIYLWYYHAGSGLNQEEEYLAAMKKGEEEKAAYLANAANNVDENTVTLITDGVQISAAQNLFQMNCAACHAGDGGGGVGPNLTDAYWLHGGSVKDVFKSIKYGIPAKGMKSWKDDFSPKQIAGLASYIKTLQGTTPAAPKEKQGELYSEDGGGAEETSDSTASETPLTALAE